MKFITLYERRKMRRRLSLYTGLKSKSIWSCPPIRLFLKKFEVDFDKLRCLSYGRAFCEYWSIGNVFVKCFFFDISSRTISKADISAALQSCKAVEGEVLLF